MNETHFIYLHGFASSPQSHKATAFKTKFDELGVPLIVPDLDGGDFRHLTISSQMQIIRETLTVHPETQYALIGSSMGGYLSALTGQQDSRVKGLYLMCPGFNVVRRWRTLLAEEIRAADQGEGLIQVFNYRYNKEMEFDLGIFKDAEKWESIPFDRPVPTRIVHGIHDETVDISESRIYSSARTWVHLKEVNSDHSLLSHLDWIIEDCMEFFKELSLLRV